MNSPETPATPPSNGRDPAQAPDLLEVKRRLAELRPGEPPAEARDRVWQAVAARLDAAQSPEQAAATRLSDLRPAEPSAQTRDRLWRRIQAAERASSLPHSAVLSGAHPPTRSSPLTRSRAHRLTRQLAFAAGLVLLVLVVTANNVALAALPGDTLYPLKRFWEDTRLALALLPDARARVALDLAEERLEEADALVEQGRSPDLVAQTVDAAVEQLDAATAELPDAVVAAAVDDWTQAAGDWPPDYADAASKLDQYLGELPVPTPANPATATLPPNTPLPTATPAPGGTDVPAITDVPPALTTAAPTLVPASTETRRPGATSTKTQTGPTPSATPTGDEPALPSATVDATNATVPTLPVGTLLPGPTATRTPATPAPSPTPVTPTPSPTLPLPTLTLPALLPTATSSPTRTATPNGGGGPAASPTPILPLPTLTLPVPTITLPVP